MIIDKSDLSAVNIASHSLRANHVTILPGDTVYGFTCRNMLAKKVDLIKGRAPDKPYLQIIASMNQYERISTIPFPEPLRGYWPGPLTVIVPSKSGGTQALRYVDDPFLHAVLEEVGEPLISTSVNRSGEPVLDHIDVIIAQFRDQVDLIITDGDKSDARASTIIDITHSPWKILRAGELQLPDHLFQS